MKKLNQFAVIIFCCLLSNFSFGQHSFSSCSAAFLGNKMLVNEYSDKGKCILPSTATGELTVSTVSLSPTESKAVDKLSFKVAIRDKSTKTLTMYAREDFMKIDVQKVLARCKKGDSIVLLTLDNQFALPHNEILVQ